MKRIRLGLIGLGLIGTPHAQRLRKLEECELTAVSDIDEQHAQTAAGLAARYFRDYREMIAGRDLDGVIVATPNHLHAEIGIACAERGLHIFMEKPIAPTLAEADLLIEAAHRHDVQIVVGHQRRFNARVEKARDIVSGGELGQLVGVTATWAMLKHPEYFEGPFTWRKEKGGGPILINLIHEVDNLRYICGEIDEVFAMTGNRIRKFAVEDTAAITLRFQNGAVGTIFVSDCTPSSSAYEATTGENPLIPHDFGNCYQFYGQQASLLFPQLKKLFYPDSSGIGWHYPITEQGIRLSHGEDPYVSELRHFIEVIRGEQSPRCSGEDARTTLAVTLAIQRSGETGRPVQTAK